MEIKEQEPEQPTPTISDLLAMRERLGGKAEDLRRQLESTLADLNAVERTIGIMEGHQGSRTVLATTRIREIEPDIDLTGVAVSFEGAESVKDKLVRIAETRPDLLLNITQVGRLLLGSGATDKTLHNMRVTVERTLKRHPEIFQRVRPATFRYVAPPDPNNPVQETQDDHE